MNSIYFNHRNFAAESYWERSAYTSRWWRIYEGDPHWAPPYYPRLRWELEPANNPHLRRFDPVFTYTEAMPKQAKGRKRMADVTREAFFSAGYLESAVAACVALPDLRKGERVAYLAGLRWANDKESLERFIEGLADSLRKRGVQRLIGPTGLSTHLGSGLLMSHWSEEPPLHTPYAPPYMAEQAAQVFEPLEESCLYHLAVGNRPPGALATPANGVNIVPLDTQRLGGDLLKLFAACAPHTGGFVPPDEAEIQFLLRWTGDFPQFSWLALKDGVPAGFIVLQPDLAPALLRWGGGRRLIQRLALKIDLARKGQARSGRVVFGGVLPRLRGKGIGKGLLVFALLTAHSQGWETLTVGPLPDGSLGAEFLKKHGAIGRQRYALYQMEI